MEGRGQFWKKWQNKMEESYGIRGKNADNFVLLKKFGTTIKKIRRGS